MSKWNKLCEVIGIIPEKDWHFEILKGKFLDCFWCNFPVEIMQTYKNAKCTKFRKIYPQPTAEKREQLEEMIIISSGKPIMIDKMNGLFCYDAIQESRWVNPLYTSDNKDRTEALAGLMLQIDWSDSEKLQIKEILNNASKKIKPYS